MDIYTMDAKNLLMFAQNRTKKQQQSSADDVDKSKRETQNDHLTIDDEYVPKICFAETLCVVDTDGEVLGEFVGKIRSYGVSNAAGAASMTVNMHSTSASDDGGKTTMTVVTNTASDFDSYDEKWSQRYENISGTVRKTVLISKEKGGESVDVCTELDDDGLVDRSENVDAKYSTSLLTEGMNYAYIRYLAVKGFEGTVKTKTAVTVNGRLCKAIYKCSLRDKYELNGACVPVAIVKRILIDGRSAAAAPGPQHMTAVLTRSGYMLKHSWSSNTAAANRRLIVCKSMRITDFGIVSEDTVSCLQTNWDRDVCFKSMYLDTVSEMRVKYKNYLKNTRAVKEMIVDYVKEILISKPDDVLQFSIDYFNAL